MMNVLNMAKDVLSLSQDEGNEQRFPMFCTEHKVVLQKNGV